MQLPEFVYITIPDQDDNLILQTVEPRMIGRVVKSSHIMPARLLAKCPGYSVFVQLHGFMSSKHTSLHIAIHTDEKELQDILTKMAMYYYDTRIHPNQGRFKRYKD